MTIAYDHDHTARRDWYLHHHVMRLIRREARQDQEFRARFWLATIPACLLFWALVAWGIHSL